MWYSARHNQHCRKSAESYRLCERRQEIRRHRLWHSAWCTVPWRMGVKWCTYWTIYQIMVETWRKNLSWVQRSRGPVNCIELLNRNEYTAIFKDWDLLKSSAAEGSAQVNYDGWWANLGFRKTVREAINITSDDTTTGFSLCWITIVIRLEWRAIFSNPVDAATSDILRVNQPRN